MDNSNTLARIRSLALPFIESMGLVLWGLEIAGGAGRPAVRIFLDGPDGVDVEQCASVSRQLGLVLEVEDVMHGPYQLEVSSPGLERRFFEFSQLAPYVGQEIEIVLATPLDGRKRFKGVLAGLGESDFTLSYEGMSTRFPWAEVTKSRLVYVFDSPKPR